MYSYTIVQWVTFFYIYSFIGWCFESTVVSIDQRKLTNRGFMRGPMLPLYGTGAIVVLFSTMPVRDNPFLTYLFGALAATALEYVTGVCMEALFQVRYWDYSQKRFQFQGHICLTSTLAWGALSLIMVRVHQPFERAVLMVPQELLTGVVLAITFVAAGDFATSFRTAIDLKHLLMHSQKLQEEMQALQERADQLEQLILREKERLSQERERFTRELQSVRERQAVNRARTLERLSRDKARMLLRNPSALSKKYKDALERIKEQHVMGKDS